MKMAASSISFWSGLTGVGYVAIQLSNAHALSRNFFSFQAPSLYFFFFFFGKCQNRHFENDARECKLIESNTGKSEDYFVNAVWVTAPSGE